jgi:hypothetical protein
MADKMVSQNICSEQKVKRKEIYLEFSARLLEDIRYWFIQYEPETKHQSALEKSNV